jgi:hypothetical protein
MSGTGHWPLLLHHLSKHDVFPVSSMGIALAAHARIVVLAMVLRTGICNAPMTKSVWRLLLSLPQIPVLADSCLILITLWVRKSNR